MGERPPPAHVVLEVARLAALQSFRVLDTAPFAALDRLVHDAARYLGRTMAALSLVDSDRVWFKAAAGVDWRTMQRQCSFCHYAIAQAEPLVVPDASADARFYQHPAVSSGPGLRFYAGVNLEDEDGYRLGAVCVLDQSPGTVSVADLAILSHLAAEAMSVLSAHRQTALLPADDAGTDGNSDFGGKQVGEDGGRQAARAQGWLGVRTTRADATSDGDAPGLIVVSVAANSPAQRAGLLPSDILVAIDGQVLRRPSDIIRALRDRPRGVARLQVKRGGKFVERMALIETPPARAMVMRR